MAAWNPQANEIFLKAVEIPAPDDRRAFLDEACRGNVQLRGEVEGLIAAGEQAGSFLESPPPGVTAAINPSDLSEQPGAVIGPYKLLEQIGEGGMGVVFMAEQQEPVRRKVALKVIKPGMDTRQVIARFDAERQALAVMDHPSIARVLDAGSTESGRPYFVMELVRGVPITTYCDDNNLPVRERLELFASVCQAIQHAHTKGIVHRDIKPTNVLVTRQDGRPAVKVIDFGVAKAMGQQLTEKTLFTNFAQMIGTPLYMSPEQAEQSGVDIDTRSDIYSLGVLLYELLTGSTPVNEEQMRKAAFDEVRRIIREDEPQTPSARISGSHTLPAIAAHRHIEPARLSKLVRGELDWIVMKALEKDRSRRYETANAFAADLSHYLNDEPVQACPPSATYRFGKFARRNRVAITTATLVALALVLGTIVSTWQAIRAETARTAEVQQRKSAESARSAESEQRKVAEAERSEAERQRERAEANFQRARETVDDYFTLVSESTLLDVPGVQALRKDLLDKALEFYKKTSAERTDDPAALADVALAYLRVAQMDHAIGQNDDCALAISSGMDIVDRLRRDYPHAAEQHRRLAGFWKGYRPGQTRTAAPKNPLAALKTLQRAIATWQELSDTYPDQLGFRSDLASMCYLTARLLEGLNERESLRYYERSKTLLEELVVNQPNAPQHQADLARTYQGMVGQLSRAGRPAEAEAAESRSLSLREALVTESPNFPQYRGELALILAQRAATIAKRQPAEADKMFQRAVNLSLGLVREFPEVVINYQLLALNLKAWARYVLADGSPEQQEQFERTVHGFFVPAADGSIGANVHFIREQLALARRDVAKAGLGDPEKLHVQALVDLDELTRVFPKEPKYVEMAGHSYRYLGWITRDAGRPDDALENFDKGVAAFQKLVDTKNPGKDTYYRRYLIDTLLQKVDILAGAGRAEDAEKTSRQVLEMYESLAREYPKDVELRQKAALAVSDLVALLTKSGRQEEVAEVYRQAIARLEERVDDPQVRIYRGTLHRDSGEVDKAIADFSWAIAKDPKLAEAWDLRGNCYLRKGEFAKVVEDYSEAIKLKPREWWYWHERAHAYLVLGQHEKAVADHSQVIRLSDHDPGTRQRRGDSYRALGEWEKAEQDYTRAIELNGGAWEAWHNRGLVYLQLKQDDKALNDFVKAAELYPKDADFLNTLAWGFATSVDATARNPGLAVELAKLAQRAFRSIPAGERIGSINATAFAHWNVTRGTVDLLGNGLFDIYPGNGLYVDLDGSTGSAGRLESKSLFTLPAGTYDLRFDLGNTGGSPNSVRVTLGSLFDETFERTETAPLETIARTISVTDPTSANLVFDHAGGDNFGLVIDNVKLTSQDSGTILLDDNFTFAGAVELHPKNLDFLNTLGVAHYRARNWKDSVEALEKCRELHAPNESYGSFFLAMAHWQLGNKDEARKSYAKGVEWMDKHAPANEELKRFRAEAEALLEVNEQKEQ